MDINTATTPGKDFPGNIQNFYQENGHYYFDAEKTRLEVKIVTDSIIRFRFCSDYFANDFSYAINPSPGTLSFQADMHENDTE